MRLLPPAISIVVLVASACGGGGSTPLPAIEGIREVRSGAARAAVDEVGADVVAKVVAADRQFAFRLYRQFVRSESGNLFYSPYSISTALSMAYAGARQATASQMAHALGIDVADAAWHAGRNSIELQLAAVRPVPTSFAPLKLEPTNGLFGQDGFAFEPEYLRILAADYGAGLQAVDFATRAAAARDLINAWVANRTADRIKDLLPEGSVTNQTVAVLVNAIYFKANWSDQFDPEATKPQEFNGLDGSTVSADQMHGRLMTDYAAGDGWQAVRLRYAGDASMTVIVPDAGQFAAVEGKFDDGLLAAVEDELASADVVLDMPKWDSASAIDLKPPLQALGITDLFGAADLTGISAAGGLAVSDAVHQANITVDEQGTEAAAATALAIGGSAPAKTVKLSVDRPFIYLISDDVTGEILFVGRVVDPTAG
jgi:serpin B